jgi:two-component system sensor kinase FixL
MEHLLSAIEQASIDAIITIDTSCIVQTFNPAAERIFGYSAAEAVGQNVKMLMPMLFREQHDTYVSNYLRTGERKIIGIGRIVTGQKKDGSTFPMELSVGEATAEGRRIFVGFVRDLSEIESNHRRIQQLQSELFHVSRLTEMGQVASSLAHEVSQPLAAIMNFVQAAEQMVQMGQAGSPVITGLLGKIEAQASRASDIVKRLRAFVEKREFEHKRERLGSVIEEALALALVGSRGRDVQLQLTLGAGDEEVNIDRVQIQQVLVNFIRNAIDAMDGSANREVMIETLAGEADHVQVVVSDLGSGVDEEVAGQLFDAFVTTKAGGMGVGLSICKAIIEAHDGTIGFRPNVPRGTSFYFTLPIATPRAALEEMINA